jgi:sialate O-acetylesterase
MKKVTFILIAGLFLINFSIQAEVRLPSILTDNMVLQREIPVNIWGWAIPGEKVTISLNNQKASVKADVEGKWKVQLTPMKAGGPFEMHVYAKNEIVLKNILIGDVWVCGGQSNMEWILQNSLNWDKEADSAGLPNIRLLTISKKMSNTPKDDVENSKWLTCDANNAAVFSAIGYYFGKDLNHHLNVPIGLINSNWGGTDIETWISMESMQRDNDYKKIIENMKSKALDSLQKEAELKERKWMDTVTNFDRGIIEKWYLAETNLSGWKEIQAPGIWESQGYQSLDGVAWYRKEFNLSTTEANAIAEVSLGPVDDFDETYINGKLIGKTEKYDIPRKYKIQPGILRAGKNVICVKVTDTGGGGGIWGNSNQMYIDAGGTKKSLAGTWLFRVSIDLPAQKAAGSPNSFPSMLYNAMIHPLLNFGIKGVIWYQGENNTGNPIKYRTLFPSLINDWRSNWKEGEFPFLFVQLANYMAPNSEPGQSNWAELREAQAMTLSVPKTGMACIIDIGEANSIHPLNKRDVGYRLALAAYKVAYNENIVFSGPVYKAMKIENDKIIIEFDNMGSGLLVRNKNGYINAFTIAGSDKTFHWAKAFLEGNKVIVFSEEVKNPVAVRYAWANNPDDVNLYNKEMLPAVPFRTDSW